ncbi:hypothetical protein DVH24_024241 [Malus domestica]|uniref:DUF620 domain-containing protein n=1 Tax=Malus domestica TaxID=3750 RepID=A0A498JIA5_MALDO|nr:hypothetical protein DVH24_024241 [Malus domestica]
MRKLCPNLDREDGLETVLEVPIPEEMCVSGNHKNATISWHNMKSWMKPSNNDRSQSANAVFGSKNTEVQLLLGVIGAPLIPLPIPNDQQPISHAMKDQPIESSMAKYLMKQYIAAVGGEKALNSVDSMYAMGKVKMAASEFCTGERSLNGGKNKLKVKSLLRSVGGGGEMGGFVLWQKRPELWCLELVVSGCKISAGSDGKGLDPRSTANLFSNSVCIGEKAIKDEDCFILKLEAEPSTLKARSSSNVEIIRHTVWGYFSQKTGLLVQLEDSHLLRIKSAGNDHSIFWETTMESYIQDYRNVEGISIAHGGKTCVSLFRLGDSTEGHSRTRMEEAWEIEEVDFNIKGLSMDCFLPPGDLKKEEEEGKCGAMVTSAHSKLPYKIRSASWRISASKVAALEVEYDSEHSDSSD